MWIVETFLHVIYMWDCCDVRGFWLQKCFDILEGVFDFIVFKALWNTFSFALLRSRPHCKCWWLPNFGFKGKSFIVATVGWCPLNFALRVTRQAWLQQSGHPIIHMGCVDFSVHATAKNACASYGTWLTNMQFFGGIPGSSFCSSLVGNTRGAQETTFLCAKFCWLYSFWLNYTLQFRTVSGFSSLWREVHRNDMHISSCFCFISQTLKWDAGCTALCFRHNMWRTVSYLFAIPYPKRCCDHDNPHSTVVSYS